MHRRTGPPSAFAVVVRIALVSLLAAVGGALLLPAAAGAHSVLESSSPASGETVATVPERITLTFNEPVILAEGAVRLLDVEGDEVEIDKAVAVDASVTADLPPDLPDGSYVVAWKVMSADSHPVSGAYTFAIGAPSVASDGYDALAAAQAEEATSSGAQAAVDIAAALAYAGALLAVGAAIFLAFVVEGPLDLVPQPVRRLVPIGAAIGTVGLIAAPFAQAALIDARWPSGRTLDDQVFGSPGLQGVIGLVGLGLLLLAVSSRILLPTVRRIVVADGTLAALAAFVIVGHTRTATPFALTVAVDIVHLLAAAVWTGGLVALLMSMRNPVAVDAPADDADVPTADDAPLDATAVAMAGLVARFSAVASVAIFVVAAAGAVLGWRIVKTWDALTGTTYGVLLLVKVGLFVVLAAVGAFNRFRLVGRVATPDAEAGHAVLRRTLSAEVLLVVAIIGVTGSFTSISPEEAPPATPQTTPLTCDEVAAMEGMPGMENMDHTCVGGAPTSTQVPFDPTAGAGDGGAALTGSAPFGDGLALVTVAPGTTGANTVSIALTDEDGNSIDPEESPTVSFRLREKEVGPINQTAERVGPGAFRVKQDLVLAGEWEISVSAVVSDFEQPQAVVKVTVPS